MINVRLERTLGEELIRNNSKRYTLVNIDKNFATVSMSEADAEYHIRKGGICVEVKKTKNVETATTEQPSIK